MESACRKNRARLCRHRLVLCAATFVAACAGARGGTVGSSPGSVTAAEHPITASSDADYRRIQREVVQELNAVRADPRGYASNLSSLLPHFNGNLLLRPGTTVAAQTVEGPNAVRKAIAALQSQAAEPALVSSSGLSSAATDLVDDQSRTGGVGHTGSRGSTPESRISAHGTWSGSYAENVTYGQFTSGRDVVVDLLVDDGVPGRGHRRNIFDPSARVVGVSCGRHPRYGSMCVIDQAASYQAR